MFKKILMWSIYAGVVGLLIFGAVIRTEAKTAQENSQPEARLEGYGSDSLGQGGQGTGRSGEGESSSIYSGGGQGAGQGSGQAAEGAGRNGGSSGSGDEVHLAEDEEHDWIDLAGTVTGLDAESLWIETDQKEALEITGRAWRFILESGMEISVGDELALEGFYEDGEFEVSFIKDLTSGVSLQIREESGRPLWAGGR